MKNLLVAAMLIIAFSTVASADDFRPIFHPPTLSEHHPLINGKARVLKSDIEGKNSVIQVIDAVLIP